MKIDITSEEALALRNCVLTRLVDVEQHKYQEEFEGEALALRRIGNLLESQINRWADRTQRDDKPLVFPNPQKDDSE